MPAASFQVFEDITFLGGERKQFDVRNLGAVDVHLSSIMVAAREMNAVKL
jgi:hypothetical protein